MFVDVAYLQLMKCTIQNSPAHRYGGTLSDREECIEEFNPPAVWGALWCEDRMSASRLAQRLAF